MFRALPVCFVALLIVFAAPPVGFAALYLYINLRRSRDVASVRLCVRAFVRSCVIQFALGSFYADCPHKRI